MKSMFYYIHKTVTNAVERAGFPTVKVLSFLGIRRSWYYAQLSFSPLLDSRFNPYAIRSNDEWIVVGLKEKHPGMSFREIAYTLIDENIADILERRLSLIPDTISFTECLSIARCMESPKIWGMVL